MREKGIDVESEIDREREREKNTHREIEREREKERGMDVRRGERIIREGEKERIRDKGREGEMEKVVLFYCISTFVDYLMPNPSLYKISTISNNSV